MTTQLTQVCEICSEGITDPVCMNCYNRELLVWLRENIGHKDMIGYILKRAVRNAFFENLGDDYCILCGREGVFICRHCYFSTIKRILQEINIPNNAVNDFSGIFDNQIYYTHNH